MKLDTSKVYLIAEIGMNHEGSLGQAKMLAKAAAENGADSVKFQMHISCEETLHNAPTPAYFKNEGRYEYFDRTAFNKEQWIELRDYCHELGVDFMVSPFSIEAVRRLVEIGVDIIKIPSGEVTNTPYLEYIAKTGICTILSSGMSTDKEVREAYDILKQGTGEVLLLQCSSEYPCRPENLGLNVMQDMMRDYEGVRVGLSDHSFGIWSSISAVTLGATMIERHFTLSKLMYGPDAKMSLEPAEFKMLRESIDNAYVAIHSSVDKSDISQYEQMRVTFQKSIVAKSDLKAGTVLSEEHFAYKKPGDGIIANRYRDLIGKKLNRDVNIDDKFTEDMFD